MEIMDFQDEFTRLYVPRNFDLILHLKFIADTLCTLYNPSCA